MTIGAALDLASVVERIRAGKPAPAEFVQAVQTALADTQIAVARWQNVAELAKAILAEVDPPPAPKP